MPSIDSQGMHRFRLAVLVFPLLALSVGCGIAVSRGLDKTSLNEAIYDDVCGLQDYFDRRAMGAIRAPEIVATQEMEKTEGKRASGGTTRFSFTTDGQLRVVRKLLTENYRRLPDELEGASRVDLTVRWSERAENRFVVMSEEAELTVNKESYDVPYHHCLSALLFGDSLYRSRRIALNLPALPTPDASPPPSDTSLLKDATSSLP